jgi:hypothetical protein
MYSPPDQKKKHRNIQTTDGASELTTALRSISPNPFNPSTSVSYSLAAAEHVRIKVYDVSGALVRTLVDNVVGRGAYEVAWDGRDGAGRAVGSGIYFVLFEAGQMREVRKAVLLK